MQVNTPNWTSSYKSVTHNPALRKIRRYFQEKAFYDFVNRKDSHILDIGCGSGEFLMSLSRDGFNNLRGVDPNEDLVAAALKASNGKVQYQVGGTDSLPYENEIFDFVYMFNVWHHIENIDGYIKAVHEVDRVIKPGGLIIFVEPCRQIIYTAKRNVAGALAGISPFFARMRDMMMEEKDLTEYFFQNGDVIKKEFIALRYRPLRDGRLFHQRTFVAEKSG
jgi:2-polyprenyl-3-methyl-5-hydroxy-6-metoxy-1,4-benzoquinol methylase